jgi:hypothetical protein
MCEDGQGVPVVVVVVVEVALEHLENVTLGVHGVNRVAAGLSLVVWVGEEKS